MVDITKKQQIKTLQRKLDNEVRQYKALQEILVSQERHLKWMEDSLKTGHVDENDIRHDEERIKHTKDGMLVHRKQIFLLKQKLAKLGVTANTGGVR